MNILVIGDSHSYAGWENISIPEIKIKSLHLGPKLMYSFGKSKMKVVNDNNIKNIDVIVFCFGEIDVRCHIPKYKNEYEKVIENLVDNYFESIKSNVNILSNIKVCVYNIPPPSKSFEVKNKNFPFVGTDQERKIYTLTLNEKLRESCKKNKFVFIDIYSFYCDDEGFLNEKVSDGTVHIKEPKPLINFITENL